METRQQRIDRLEAEKNAQDEHRKEFNRLVASVKSDCRVDNSGLQSVEYKLEHIRSNRIEIGSLSNGETIEAYEKGIGQYKAQIKRKNEEG